MCGDISKVIGVVVWGLMCSSSAPRAFCNPSEQVKEWYKNSPLFRPFELPTTKWVGEWVCSYKLNSPRLHWGCWPASAVTRSQGGQRPWASVDSFDLLSFRSFECCLDQSFLTHLLLVRLEILWSSLWGKKEPKAQRLPSWGGFCTHLLAPPLGSLLAGLDVGGWVSWNQE